MARGFRIFKLLITLLILPYYLSASANPDANLSVDVKHTLENAVQVRVTPRGMNYFSNRLGEILGNLGVNLDEGYFSEMTYTAQKPIHVEDYKDSNPEAVKMYIQVRDLLAKWFIGFSLNDHRPSIAIGESGYVAQFSRFGLVTDQALMKALGKRDGAVLAIELEVKKMTISTDSVMVWDSNNEFLGKAGFEKVTIATDGEDTPLKIRLPFYIRTSGEGIEFEAFEVSNNIDSIPLALKYEKLIVPTFAIEVNGKKFYLNNSEVDKLLVQNAPMILQKVRESLGDFARNKLPELLNKKSKEVLGGSLEQVQYISPPGKEPQDNRPDFKWGLKLQKINLDESLAINLSAFVEDPLNYKSTPAKSAKSRGTPPFNVVSTSEYDIGLSIDRALINRILQLSYERKNFEKIQQSDGSSLKLRAAPSIDFVSPPAGAFVAPTETFIKLHVSVENEPDSIFLKDTIVVDFDIIAKLRQKADNSGMQMVLYSIDLDSVWLDPAYISFAGKLLKGKVISAIKDQLKKKSSMWKINEEAIPGVFPLPPKILGLNLDIQRVLMAQEGHLVMFLKYAKGAR